MHILAKFTPYRWCYFFPIELSLTSSYPYTYEQLLSHITSHQTHTITMLSVLITLGSAQSLSYFAFAIYNCACTF